MAVPRLNDLDRRRLEQLEASLLVVRLDRPDDLADGLRELRLLLGVEQTVVWGQVAEGPGLLPVFSYRSGGRSSSVAAHEVRFALSSGPTLVAWLAAYAREPISSRQETLLRRLVPAFRRRLTAVRALAETGGAEAEVTAVLAAVARPAFLIDGQARLRNLNVPARELLGARGDAVATTLAAVVTGTEDGVDVTPVETERGRRYLVVFRPEGAGDTARQACAAATWKLTRRQREVLDQMIVGDSNKAIAARLGTTERTVEAHVTNILRRARVKSRAAVVAQVFASR